MAALTKESIPDLPLPAHLDALRRVLERPRLTDAYKLGACLVAVGVSYRKAARRIGKRDHWRLFTICREAGIGTIREHMLKEASVEAERRIADAARVGR